MAKPNVKSSTSVVVSQYAATSYQPRETAREEPDIRLARYLQMTMAGLTAAVALLILINQDQPGLNATAITDTSVIDGGIQDQQARHTTREPNKQASDHRPYRDAAKTSPSHGSLLRI